MWAVLLVFVHVAGVGTLSCCSTLSSHSTLLKSRRQDILEQKEEIEASREAAKEATLALEKAKAEVLELQHDMDLVQQQVSFYKVDNEAKEQVWKGVEMRGLGGVTCVEPPRQGFAQRSPFCGAVLSFNIS